ncbi:MAG: DEAD/DEAH box helicase [Clostridia bacterium]|nr:DEAD/DEAH box helicase [Clostridia bacterium]
MKREFTFSEAANLALTISSLHKTIEHNAMLMRKLESDIKIAADAYIEGEIFSILNCVPVSELNRDKNGFRIKALEDGGYKTMANVYRTPEYQLACVYGISSESAHKIKYAADFYANEVRKQVRITLSYDKRDDDSTCLVKAVSVYKNAAPYIQGCSEIYSKYNNNVRKFLNDIKPASGAIRWAFSFKATKQRAVDAYNSLEKLAEGDYAREARYNSEKTSRCLNVGSEEVWRDFLDNSIRFYNILEKIVPGYLGNDDSSEILSPDLLSQIQKEEILTEGLKCELRNYQVLGTKYILHQRRVLLGDEMGLGKTIQAIAAMVTLRNKGATHFLVVCPASVIMNWYREVRRHCDIEPVVVYGSYRTQGLNYWFSNGGVALTTYETTSRIILRPDLRISLIVVDEAHYIKNPQAKRTQNTQKLCRYSDRILFMTGTALENRVDEMISLMAFLQPDIAIDAQKIAFMSSAPQFRKKVAPVYFRRKREDVLTELPKLTECYEWCPLNRDERLKYVDAILQKNFNMARRVSWNVDDIRKSSKALRLLELVDEAESDNRKVVVYSFFLDTVHKIYNLLCDKCVGYLDGSVSPDKRQNIIDRFENDKKFTVLVAQIQTGGIGLNIQAASVVVICEPQLKPSSEMQAISRVYRMGQARNVMVYRLLSENTIDVRITDLLKIKQAAFDAFADKSEYGDLSVEIDNSAIERIIQQEIERINSHPDDWQYSLGDVSI